MTSGGAGGDGVRFATAEGILRVSLDRPEAKNSLTPEAIRRIIEVLEDAALDDSLRVVLLDSTGEDFCAGADVVSANAGRDTPKPRPGSLQRRTGLQAHRLVELLMSIQLPVVCAVRGWAAGLGFQLALAADFAVVSDTATFWEPFVSRGFTPDSGATWLLPRLIGIARAKELLMLGEHISGDEAADWGLVHTAVPDAEVDTVAGILARRLASGPTVALGLTKACIHSSLELSLTEAMAKEVLALELSCRTQDFREGMAAFGERREPDYGGR